MNVFVAEIPHAKILTNFLLTLILLNTLYSISSIYNIYFQQYYHGTVIIYIKSYAVSVRKINRFYDTLMEFELGTLILKFTSISILILKMIIEHNSVRKLIEIG